MKELVYVQIYLFIYLFHMDELEISSQECSQKRWGFSCYFFVDGVQIEVGGSFYQSVGRF